MSGLYPRCRQGPFDNVSPLPAAALCRLIVVTCDLLSMTWRASIDECGSQLLMLWCSMLSRATSWRCPDCGVIARRSHGRVVVEVIDAPCPGISDAGYAANIPARITTLAEQNHSVCSPGASAPRRSGYDPTVAEGATISGRPAARNHANTVVPYRRARKPHLMTPPVSQC